MPDATAIDSGNAACGDAEVTPQGHRVRVVVAVATSLLLLACGVLGRVHEAQVAHAIDARGATVHATATGCVDNFKSPQRHVHELPGDGDHDTVACALAAAVHHAITASVRIEIVHSASHRAIAAVALRDRHVTSVLLVAPKTSPPREA